VERIPSLRDGRRNGSYFFIPSQQHTNLKITEEGRKTLGLRRFPNLSRPGRKKVHRSGPEMLGGRIKKKKKGVPPKGSSSPGATIEGVLEGEPTKVYGIQATCVPQKGYSQFIEDGTYRSMSNSANLRG